MYFLDDWRVCLSGCMVFLFVTIFTGEIFGLFYVVSLYYLALKHFEEKHESH